MRHPFIKSVKYPSGHFDIKKYVNFCNYSTRSTTSNKLKHTYSSSNKQKNFYFNRLPRVYNALPAVNLNLSFGAIKSSVKKYLWEHFIRNFNNDDLCTYHFVCPCCNCTRRPQPANFTLLSDNITI